MTSEAVAAPPVTLGTFLGPIEKAETAEEAVFAMGRLLEAAFKSRRVTVIKDDVRAACKVAKDKLGDETWIAGGCAAQFRALFVRFKRGEGEVERLIGAHVYIATGWGVYPGRVTDYIEEAEAGGGGSRPVAALGFAGKFKAASAASIGGGSGGGGGGGGGRGGRGKGGAEKEGGERDANQGLPGLDRLCREPAQTVRARTEYDLGVDVYASCSEPGGEGGGRGDEGRGGREWGGGGRGLGERALHCGGFGDVAYSCHACP